jgi:GTPase SAR1 family protein
MTFGGTGVGKTTILNNLFKLDIKIEPTKFLSKYYVKNNNHDIIVYDITNDLIHDHYYEYANHFLLVYSCRNTKSIDSLEENIVLLRKKNPNSAISIICNRAKDIHYMSEEGHRQIIFEIYKKHFLEVIFVNKETNLLHEILQNHVKQRNYHMHYTNYHLQSNLK